MRFAQIQDNKAHWVFEAETKPVFAPYIVLVDITDKPEVQEGWRYIDGKFVDPTPTLDMLKEAKREEMHRERRAEMDRGISYKGNYIPLDTDSVSRLSAALQLVQSNPNVVVDWKMADGIFISVTAVELSDMVVQATSFPIIHVKKP